MKWLLAVGAIPTATLLYGFGTAQPDAPRWLALSILVSLGLILVNLRTGKR